MPLPDAPARSGQGELPTRSLSLINQYLSGPSKRERGSDAARSAGCSRLPEVHRQSSEWQGCVLQGLLNVVGWAAGRIVTPFSDSTVRFSGEKWKRWQGSLPLPGRRCLDWKGCWAKTRRFVSAVKMSLRVTGILRQGEGASHDTR